MMSAKKPRHTKMLAAVACALTPAASWQVLHNINTRYDNALQTRRTHSTPCSWRGTSERTIAKRSFMRDGHKSSKFQSVTNVDAAAAGGCRAAQGRARARRRACAAFPGS